MQGFHFFVRASLLIVPVIALAACSADPQQLYAGHLRRGDRFVADGKLPEAIIEYRSAVQADPRAGEAREKLGNALFETREYERAFAELVRAADLLPDDLAAQLRAAQVLLLVGHWDDARARADRVLAKEPANIDALIVKGNALAGMKDFKNAIEEINRVIETDPTRSVGYAHLGALQQAQGDRKGAEIAFRKAVATDPKSTPARLSLANLYWSTGRHREAEDELKAAAQLDPSNILPQRGLALLYLGSGRQAEAEAPLKAYAEKAPGSEGKLTLADYYANRRRLDEARALYDELAAGSGAIAASAKLRIAALGLTQGDREGAYRIVDEVLAKDRNHVEALVAKSQLLFGDGKIEASLEQARKAVAAGPTSPAPHFVLGRILKASGQLEDAEAAFKESARVSPRFAPANVELARLLIVVGRYAEAATHARAALDAVPNLGDAYLLMARAQIAAGNVAAAEKALAVMSANFPNAPVVQSEVGLMKLAKGDHAGAQASFDKALAQDPTLPIAIEGITKLDLAQGRRDAARARLDRVVFSAPGNAELQVVAARFYASAFSDHAAAERAVRRALDANPNSLAAYEVLARLHATKGDLAAATVEFTKMAERQPKSVQAHTYVGILHQLQGNADAARAAYQRALMLDPRSGVAANNLAGLYLERDEQLDVALQLAQTAKASMPNSHEIDDTLGWAFYKKGNAAAAVAALRSAVDAQPDNPIYLYHLGAAYAQAKDWSRARTTLDRLLQGQPAFDGADEARRILASLR